MALHLVRPEHSELMADILRMCGKVLGAIFLCLIIYDVIKKQHLRRLAKKKGSKKNVLSNEQTSLCITASVWMEQLLILSQMAIEIYTLHYITDEEQCHLMIRINCLLLHFTGAFLYCIFVRRIEIMYKDSFFAFSWIHIHTIYLFIALYSLPYLCWIDWFALESEMDPLYGCTLRTDPWSPSSMALSFNLTVQTVIAMYTLYLFIRPLQILANEQDILNHKVSYHLTMVCIKYSILYSVIMLSSIVLSVFYLCTRYGYYYSILHSFINGTVLILVHAVHNHWYKRICCGCHFLCTLCCGENARDTPKQTFPRQSQAITPSSAQKRSTLNAPASPIPVPMSPSPSPNESNGQTVDRFDLNTDPNSDPNFSDPETPGFEVNPDYGITPMSTIETGSVLRAEVQPTEDAINEVIQTMKNQEQSIEMSTKLSSEASSELAPRQSTKLSTKMSTKMSTELSSNRSTQITTNKSESSKLALPESREVSQRDMFGRAMSFEIERVDEDGTMMTVLSHSHSSAKLAMKSKSKHSHSKESKDSSTTNAKHSKKGSQHVAMASMGDMVVNLEALWAKRGGDTVHGLHNSQNNSDLPRFSVHKSEPTPIKENEETNRATSLPRVSRPRFNTSASQMQYRGPWAPVASPWAPAAPWAHMHAGPKINGRPRKKTWGDLDENEQQKCRDAVRNTLRLVATEAFEL